MSASNFTPAEIADFTRRTSQDPAALQALNGDVVEQYRANHGAMIGGPLAGVPLLLLHTVGAKSGLPRINPLVFVEHDERWYVVGSNAGLDGDPAWAHNLRANPSARAEIGHSLREVTARELASAERRSIWPMLVAKNPTFAEYEKSTRRVMPVFELEH